MEKQLENLEKKKKAKQPSQAARPRSLTGGRHLPAAVSAPRAFPLPLSAQWGQLVGDSCFPPHMPLFPLCLAGPFCQTPSRCPARPFSLSLRRGPSLSAPPSPRPPWVSERALAHVAGILGHVALPTPQLLWRHSWKAILAFYRVVPPPVRGTTGHPLFIVRCESPS
jgi:hypothetical protein